MLEGLKQRIAMLALGRTANPGQSRSQNAQTPPEPLDQVIEGIQRQGRCRSLPGCPDRKTGEPAQDSLPDQWGGETVSRQHPGEQNRKRATATASLSAVAAEHPVASGDASFVCRRIVAVHAAVPIERAAPFAERARHGLEPAKELLKSLGILYKNHMSWFSHSRKIDHLDELSNAANDAIRAGRWDEAEKLCRRLRELYPDEVDADDRLAQLHVAQNDFAGALPYAQAALDMARNNPDKFDPELVADLAEQVDFIGKKTVK